MINRNLILHSICFLLLFTLIDTNGQDSTSSLAFKRNRPEKRTTFFYQPDLSYQLWKQFNLIREANSGDPLAQHELGIRYLLGDGLEPDTVKGAYWIYKAVQQNLTAAEFNYGILLMNGWGVKWNPFKAYDYFLKAAKEMPQAQYVIGIFHTDNLVVRKDWKLAYTYIKKAADAGYEPAVKTLKEIKSKIPNSLLDTSNVKDSLSSYKKEKQDNSLTSTLGLSFIDFESISDTVKDVSNKMLQKDLLLTGDKKILDTLTEYDDKLPKIDSVNVPDLLESAESGSPESLNFIGRLYEEGFYYKKDLITALSFYIRALRLDSPRAGWLIWNISKQKDITGLLQKSIRENDPEAMFVWYGLSAFGFNNEIVQEDAFKLLEESAKRNYLPALNELGLALNNGNYLKTDHDKAVQLWQAAAALGSMEAKIRLAATNVFGYSRIEDLNSSVQTLLNGDKLGSILSKVALGYCYEKGVGLKTDKANAVKCYRSAAQRGNRFAYDELKRMYDEIRPDKTEFKID